MQKSRPPACCPPKPVLDQRPLISPEQAAGLMGVFKILANDTRLRLLHALARSGELCVSDLADAVEMKPQAVNNGNFNAWLTGASSVPGGTAPTSFTQSSPVRHSLLDQGLCLVEDAEPRRRAASSVDPGSPSPGTTSCTEG